MSPNIDKKLDAIVVAELKKPDSALVLVDGKGPAAEEVEEPSTLDSNLRYVGYSRSLSKLFRYLAFTSDLGEAFRPVVNARIVNLAYAVSFGYCFVDVGYEAYKLRERGYVAEHDHTKTVTLTQCIVERATFQAVASIAVPTLVIHSAVDITRKVLAKVGRFQKWGPTIAGLAAVPLLPMFLDHPIEHAMEAGFRKYGPWKDVDPKPHSD
jgi:fission process protein 1